MNKDLAIDRLTNLLERASISEDKTFLTSKEIEALAYILNVDTIVKTDSHIEPISAKPTAKIQDVKIADEDVSKEAMLCIDFGTSYSKAFATLSKGLFPELIELPLSDGTERSRLITPSELLIDKGQLYFGPEARKILNDTQVPLEHLIDSIKQFITLKKDVTKLATARLSPKQDPDQLFSQRDILVLYLAHLTCLTESAISSLGHSPNMKRRFTHPAWEPQIRATNETEMRLMMAEAIVLARSAPERFTDKIALTDARALLDQLKEIEPSSLPLNLIAEPIREATAAGAGALLKTKEGKRDVYLVVDIGAGTTDVAGFYCVKHPDRELARVFEVSGAEGAQNIAGNVLDQALQRFVLDRAALAEDSEEYRSAALDIRRSNRIYKETLFSNKSVIIPLPTGQNVEVQLDEFLNYAPVKRFSKSIFEMVARSAAITAGSEDKVFLVATGGGANLPIVNDLTSNGVTYEGKHIGLKLVNAVPEGIEITNPNLVEPFPQIAVALGGSLPNLPEQGKSISAGITNAAKIQMVPTYKS